MLVKSGNILKCLCEPQPLSPPLLQKERGKEILERGRSPLSFFNFNSPSLIKGRGLGG